MGYSLKDEGETFKRIYCGKHYVGRVCQHADGTWIGVIGKYIMVRGLHSEKAAFHEATAKHMRYDSSWKKKPKPKQQAAQPRPAMRPVPVTFVAERFTATQAYMRKPCHAE